MTDHTHRLTVILEDDIRVDDAEAILEAIKMVKGVMEVTMEVSDPDTYFAVEHAKFEIREQIRKILWPR